MSKKLLLLLVVVVMCSYLVGCEGSSELKTLSELESVDSEANVSIVNLSATDKENLIYSQVSDRTLLDLASLEGASAEEVESVKIYMDSVDAQLCGTLDSSNGVISSSFTDYLLFEFQKTPFYWQRQSMAVLGVDSSSRSIVIDVNYKTINFAKDVKGDSSITLGEPNYVTKSEVRFNRYIEILASKYNSFKDVDWATSLLQFESAYGSVDSILAEQSSTTLTDSVFTTGNQITYSGLTNNEVEKSSATMTVRYVLTPNYSMGVNLGLSCTQMYLTSYNLASNEVNSEEFLASVSEDETGITEEIHFLLSSYYSCIDDENFGGLYSLVNDFETLDKHFSDLFNTSYHKHGEFTVSLHSIQGTRMECTATVSRKVRTRNSEMPLPIYTDTYYYVIIMDDGKLKVDEEILLSSKIEGEPQISTGNADTTGFSTSISLTSQDKIDLETLISKFGVLQLSSDTISSSFSDVVDISMSDSQLSTLKKNMAKLVGSQRVTWITSYLQGQRSYASIRCKEMLQKEDGVLYDCTVTYDFINKGNKWYIQGYTVNSKNKLDSTSLATKNCLCLVTKEGIDIFNSKVTVADDEVSSDIIVGVTVAYSEYEPIVKIGTTVSSNSVVVKTTEELIAEIDSLRKVDVVELTSFFSLNEGAKNNYIGILSAYSTYFEGNTTTQDCIDTVKSYNFSGDTLGEVWQEALLADLDKILQTELSEGTGDESN